MRNPSRAGLLLSIMSLASANTDFDHSLIPQINRGVQGVSRSTKTKLTKNQVKIRKKNKQAKKSRKINRKRK